MATRAEQVDDADHSWGLGLAVAAMAVTAVTPVVSLGVVYLLAFLLDGRARTPTVQA